MSDRPGAAEALRPGATVGVLGGGQLGRMLARVAGRMGYRAAVFDPAAGGPAAQVAQHETVAPWDDLDAVRRFARSVDVVTIEFENIPLAALEAAGEHAPLRPPPRALEVAQRRDREKAFVSQLGIPVAPHATVDGPDDLAAALRRVGTPAILKSAGFGYDGKGQRRLARDASFADATRALDAVGAPAVLEQLVTFDLEFSVIVARGADGALAFYPPIENRHVGGVLDVSLAPGRVPPRDAAAGRDIAATIAEALDYVGVLCVEFFLTEAGPVVNEIAPRPHNSGHLTIEATACSQFEQQLRAACALPLGPTALRAPAAMANLFGDLWAPEPAWRRVLEHPGIRLHLYGKRAPRPGRKMGHLTALAIDTDVGAARGGHEPGADASQVAEALAEGLAALRAEIGGR